MLTQSTDSAASSVLPRQTRLAAMVLLTLTTGGCLGSGNNCPPLHQNEDVESAPVNLFPACSGRVEQLAALTESQIPAYNQEVTLENASVRTRRVTQNGQRNSGDPILRHHYSRRQAWNADETLIDLNNAIVHADTLEPHPANNPFSSERLWSNLDPAVLIGIRYNPTAIELASFNVNTLTYTSIHRFEDYRHCTLGQAEGNLSNDDKRVVLTCKRHNDKIDIIAYDIEQQRILGSLEAAPNLNWASITPSGQFVVVENNHHPDPNPVLLRYSLDMQNETLLMEHPAHGDLTLDDDSNDVHVMMNSRWVYYVRVKDRLKVRLPVDRSKVRFGSGHVSCRNLQRPGWCYISATQSGHIGAVKIGSYKDFDKDLAKLGASIKSGANAYEHWAQHNSSSTSYHAEAKASVSPTGRQIIFSSDWNGTSAIEEFILSFP